jgi:hypothetical protein
MHIFHKSAIFSLIIISTNAGKVYQQLDYNDGGNDLIMTPGGAGVLSTMVLITLSLIHWNFSDPASDTRDVEKGGMKQSHSRGSDPVGYSNPSVYQPPRGNSAPTYHALVNPYPPVYDRIHDPPQSHRTPKDYYPDIPRPAAIDHSSRRQYDSGSNSDGESYT